MGKVKTMGRAGKVADGVGSRIYNFLRFVRSFVFSLSLANRLPRRQNGFASVATTMCFRWRESTTLVSCASKSFAGRVVLQDVMVS